MLNQTSQPLVLRPYQKDDVALLTSKDCTACFNEQRTGKTPTALMCIKERNLEDSRVLIITTASTLYQWKDEYERWLNRECLVADGTREHKEKVISEWRFGLVISLDSLKSIKEKDGYEAFY